MTELKPGPTLGHLQTLAEACQRVLFAPNANESDREVAANMLGAVLSYVTDRVVFMSRDSLRAKEYSFNMQTKWPGPADGPMSREGVLD